MALRDHARPAEGDEVVGPLQAILAVVRLIAGRGDQQDGLVRLLAVSAVGRSLRHGERDPPAGDGAVFAELIDRFAVAVGAQHPRVGRHRLVRLDVRATTGSDRRSRGGRA